MTPFLNSEVVEAWPVISPDGRWLAYASNESETREVWVRPFPEPGGKIQISNEGGISPIWSKDGSQLFYRKGDGVWVVDINTEGGFSSSKPRLVFKEKGLNATIPLRAWDLWPDGQGFLMTKRGESKYQQVDEILIIQNWFEELKRLVPVKK